jgi:hypothetical protein
MKLYISQTTPGGGYDKTDKMITIKNQNNE